VQWYKHATVVAAIVVLSCCVCTVVVAAICQRRRSGSAWSDVVESPLVWGTLLRVLGGYGLVVAALGCCGAFLPAGLSTTVPQPDAITGCVNGTQRWLKPAAVFVPVALFLACWFPSSRLWAWLDERDDANPTYTQKTRSTYSVTTIRNGFNRVVAQRTKVTSTVNDGPAERAGPFHHTLHTTFVFGSLGYVSYLVHVGDGLLSACWTVHFEQPIVFVALVVVLVHAWLWVGIVVAALGALVASFCVSVVCCGDSDDEEEGADSGGTAYRKL
jgi:hypothetical protein